MKIITTLLFFLITISAVSAQSVADLEAKLTAAKTNQEKLDLTFKLAEKLQTSNPTKAVDYAHRASMLASELKDKRKETAALLLSAECMNNKKSTSEALARYTRAYTVAKGYGHTDISTKALVKLQDLSEKSGNFREAFRWSQEETALYRGGNVPKSTNTNSSSGTSGASATAQQRIADLEASNLMLRQEISKITGKSLMLETNYQETESKLKEVSTQSQANLVKKTEELSKLSGQKQSADSLIRKQKEQFASLSKEQVEQELMLAKAEKEIDKQKFTEEHLKTTRNYVLIGAGFLALLSLLFYTRYLAKKRTANQLSEQNKVIEAEKERSNTLLLNILPPAIAHELKSKNKVKAQSYEKATVMFIDFKGFTNVAERMQPEMLVEELDYCFSNFDRIVGQYKIEKIKTIGDAYMAASGLSDKNASPADMVKAALEIQDFLQHLKAERLIRNLPFFEARIGIHTGPVVAGVVGTKKFAYDIWGDTVNIAARVEEACETGKVCVSEDTHWLAKYEFDWHFRGKVAAKNKGMIDMYYVEAIKN